MIMASFYKGFMDEDFRYLAVSCILCFICTSGFANFAYFVAFLLLISTSILFIFISDNKRITKKNILLVFLYFMTLGSILSWDLLYTPLGLLSERGAFTSSLRGWILWQSVPLVDVLRNAPEASQFYFPETFVYGTLLKPIFVILSFVPLAFILIPLLMRPTKKVALLLGFLALITAFLIQKATQPFTNIGLFVFSLPIVEALRSYQKVAIYYPAILSFLTAICLKDLIWMAKYNRLFKMILVALIISTLLYPLPFFLGRFQQDMSSNSESDYSFLVKIPDYYYSLFNYLNNQSGDFKCAYLPLGRVIGIGWSTYPEWGYLGFDITTFLSNKPVIPSWNLFDVFNLGYNYNEYPPESLPKLLGVLNVKYILFNKDTGYQYIHNIKNEMKYMLDNNIIELTGKFGNVDVYKLSDDYYIPHIYQVTRIVFINGTITNMIYSLGEDDDFNNKSAYILSSDINKNFFLYCKIMKSTIDYSYKNSPKEVSDNYFLLKNSTLHNPVLSMSSENVSLAFKKITPTKYLISINATEPFLLVLSESYHPLWRAYINDLDASSSGFDVKDIKYILSKPLQEDYHLRVNGYANGWYIDPKSITGNETISLTLNFLPQSIFYLGIIISLITFILCLFYLSYRLYNGHCLKIK
ncbi:MAG: hypothetical protein AB9879_04780 [Methanothrix sp.]